MPWGEKEAQHLAAMAPREVAGLPPGDGRRHAHALARVLGVAHWAESQAYRWGCRTGWQEAGSPVCRPHITLPAVCWYPWATQRSCGRHCTGELVRLCLLTPTLSAMAPILHAG